MRSTLNFVFTCFFISLVLISYSQNPKLDSLLLAFRNASQDSTRIRLRAEIGETTPILRPGYWDSLAGDAHKYEVPKTEAAAYNNLGYIFYGKGDIKKAVESYRKGISIQEEMNDYPALGNSFNNLAALYESQGDFSMALSYYRKGLQVLEKGNDKAALANVYNNVGLLFQNQGDAINALECFNKALKINNEIGDRSGSANCLNSIGMVYSYQGEADKSLENFMKCLKTFEEIGDKKGIGIASINIGVYYKRKRDFKTALEYYEKSLKIREEIGNKREIAKSLRAIGSLNHEKGNDELSIDYFNRALKLDREMQDKRGIANNYTCLADSYFGLLSGTMIEAEKPGFLRQFKLYADSALMCSKQTGSIDLIISSERIAFRKDSITGNFRGAFEHYKQFIFYRDSLANENTKKAAIQNEVKYEFDKKEAVLREQQDKERSVAEEKSRIQQIVIWAVIFGLLLVVIFAMFAMRSLRTTKRQKVIIEEKQREIVDSIHYAKRIQQSLLPTEKYIDRNLNRLKDKS